MTLAVPSPSTEKDTPADLADRLKEIKGFLEMPMLQLLQHEESLRAALDAVAEHLPSDLLQALHCAADLGYHREEVTTASARIAARQKEGALKEEIAKESLILRQEKSALADEGVRSALSLELQELTKEHSEIATEIQRLQQKLSVIAGDIAAREVKMKHLDDEKWKRKEALASRLVGLRDRQSQLTPGVDAFDRAVIVSIDVIRQQALDALSSFLQ
jgi:chromosome segregation ATPase